MRKVLQFHLKRAQERMKQMANRMRSNRDFEMGDLLLPWYFDPFPVEARVGQVAYRLSLPPIAHIHPTFQVSQLEKHIASTVSSSVLPPVGSNGAILKEPIRVLDRRMVKKGTKLSQRS
ncbi:reverse transcriptase [Gossypium australe]|uniref:Reverse transcriptase n=1 Tax=Gossypium australe TaxID=47621 RepID=A0A5B6WGX1_9ROSI|nr:reverse transcriptase [Gossypium australe]